MIHIEFEDGRNKVLTFGSILKMFQNYNIALTTISTGAIFFATATVTKRKTHKEAKENARLFAIDAQRVLSNNSFSYDEIERITWPLTILGKKFGLMREFKENGIC